MGTEGRSGERGSLAALLAVLAAALGLAGCGTGPLVGMVYTRVKLPLTVDLHATPVPMGVPHTDRIVEVKEPFTGLGIHTRVHSNAIGDIARRNGLETLCFADQEVFSVLGVWKTHRVLLHGQSAAGSDP